MKKYLKISKNKVIGVSDNKLSNPELYKEIDLSDNEDKFLKILESLGNGKTPIIDDNFNIIEEKVEYWRGLPLDKVKPEDLEEIQQIQKDIDKYITPDLFVYYIEYFDVLFELANKGFFITDENKEEKYLEILETENDELIDLLEKYLEVKEKLNPIIFLKKHFDKKFDEISNNL